MFCKSGILIFIFAENNYLVRQYICPHHVDENTFAPSELWSPCLSFSLSFSGWSPGAQRSSGFIFLPGLLRPSRQGTLRLHPIKRVPEAFMNRASPVPGALLAFCVNQGISASFSLLYFLNGWLRTTRFRSIKGPQQENSGNSGRPQFFWAPKSLQMVTAAMKLKDAPWKESYDQPRQHIKKQRH